MFVTIREIGLIYSSAQYYAAGVSRIVERVEPAIP